MLFLSTLVLCGFCWSIPQVTPLHLHQFLSMQDHTHDMLYKVVQGGSVSLWLSVFQRVKNSKDFTQENCFLWHKNLQCLVIK